MTQLTYEQFIDALAALFNGVVPNTPAEVDAMLREAGYGPDELAERVRLAAERTLRNSPYYPPELGQDSKMEACPD